MNLLICVLLVGAIIVPRPYAVAQIKFPTSAPATPATAVPLQFIGLPPPQLIRYYPYYPNNPFFGSNGRYYHHQYYGHHSAMFG